MTILEAVAEGDAARVRELIAKGISPNFADERRFTPLHVAAEIGNAEIAKLLLDAGAKLEARTVQGVSALHQAIGNNHVDVAELLLDAGANNEARNLGGQRPLHYAAARGHAEALALLLRYGARIHAQ